MQDLSIEILKKAQEGDLASFEAIYRQTAGFLYNVAYRIVNSREDAEEVTQEAFLNIYHNLKYFRLESSFRTWAYRIATNCAITHFNKAARERKRREEYRGSLNPWQAIDESRKSGSVPGEAVNTLLSAVNPDQRACVVLRSIEGMSYRQIADTLKISINTVRSRLKRAREKMLAMRKEVTGDEL